MKYCWSGRGGMLSGSAMATWSDASGVTESTLSVHPVGASAVEIATAAPIGAESSWLDPGGGGGGRTGTKTARADFEEVSFNEHRPSPAHAPPHRANTHP